MEVVDRTTEVRSGVWVEPAAGPTPGHQIVICQQGKATYAFLGMLVPTSMHLSPTVNAAYDWNPEATARTKSEMQRQAALENWLVAPVGRDEWVRANQLESLAAFSLGRTELPETTKTPPRGDPCSRSTGRSGGVRACGHSCGFGAGVGGCQPRARRMRKSSALSSALASMSGRRSSVRRSASRLRHCAIDA